MLEVGWSEILVIAVVLIVVVGPKDLPPMLRAFGKMTSRLRTMAGQFQTQFNEALKDADMDNVRKTFQDAQKLNPLNTLREAITPVQQLGHDLKAELQKSVTPPSAVITPPPLPDPAVPVPSFTDASAQSLATGDAPLVVADVAPAVKENEVKDPKTGAKGKKPVSAATESAVQEKSKKRIKTNSSDDRSALPAVSDDTVKVKKKKAAKRDPAKGDA
jgi:sec-independent protein translocase protein TatB